MRIDTQQPMAQGIEGLPVRGGGAPGKAEGGGFGDWLTQMLHEVNDLQIAADQEANLLATGQTENLHEAVLAVERASLALELTVQVTKKAVEAYQEINRVQV